MKKLLAIVLTLTLALTLAACNAAPASTPAPSSTPAPATSTPPESVPASASIEDADDEIVYTLDYDAIVEWLAGGYVGVTDDGAPALVGIDADATIAIAVFADNTTMEAVSFVGEFVDNNNGTVTINDTESGLSLTFDFQKGEEVYYMGMGDLGSAEIIPVELEELKLQLKAAIDNYKHVA